MNVPPWFWPVLLIFSGMCATVVGAGFHFWPEVAVGLVLFFSGMVLAVIRIINEQ